MGQAAANRRFRPLPLAAAIAMALVPATSHAITYTVTSGLDNSGVDPTVGAGTGTLRQAIIDANANCASDPTPIIAFAIGTSPTFIGIGSPAVTTANPLPPLICASGGTYSPTIDGTTQPGHVSNSDPTGYNGSHGITIFGSGLTAASACGINFTQTAGGSLTFRGIRLSNFNGASFQTALCGTNMGVFGSTFDASAEGVRVLAGGTAIVGNNTPADRNLIHGNSSVGVNIVSANTVNVVNSFIGTTPDGNSAQPNGIGINVFSTALIQLNGNVISGNSSEGVRMFGTQGLIIGNKIGHGSLGSTLPNQTGIRSDNATGVIDIVNNEIVNNTQFGVHVASGAGVRIRQNSITANGSKNITLDMYGGGVPNDFQDPDLGPNNRQNFPVISSVIQGGGNTTVNFTLNTNPGANIDLEFYTNASLGIPGGETYRAVVNTTTNANGDSLLTSFTLAGTQDFISMTAQNTATADTSEFSPIVAATAAPAVTVAPPNLSFGNVPVNTTSPNMTANLLSSGSSPYQISQLSTNSCYGGPICYGGAEFTCMTDCITFNPYAPGQSCNITANFHPTAVGPQSVNLVVCDNATGSPRTIVVSGNGVPAPTLSLTPSFFDFGDVPVNGQSAAASFRLQNPAPTPVTFSSATNGPFAVVGSNCSNPIPGGGACDLDVAFLPTAAGLASGNLVVAPSSGSPAISALQGNGTVGPVLALPSNVDIVYTLGAPPSTQAVSLQNTGGATLTFTSITIAGPGFTLVNNCPGSLPPGSICDVIIGFSAADQGTFLGTLTIVSDAPGGSRVINLRGLASPRNVPILEVTPREIGYGRLALGSVTDGETVKVRNIGGAPAAFDSFVISPDFVILSNGCQGSPLGSLQTCELLVAMRPLSYGPRGGTLRINSNAENGPRFVDVFGTSCRGSSLVVPRLGVSGAC